MKILRNWDVASFYPHLMTINGYTSRSIPDPKIYEDMLERRMAAKKAGDKKTANALKLIANTTYGATLNQYNPLYDPLMARSVCISGQLYLLELTVHLCEAIPGLIPVATNTDGMMVEFDDQYYPQVQEIINEWQERTGFELEEDQIRWIVQANVNNYIMGLYDGHIKCKGGYLVKGIAPAGAFNINNNAVIVADALKAYFVDGTPPEVTIENCDDIFKFQMIAKAGAKYKEAFQLVDGKQVTVQKVNRVYASKDPRYGRLVKVKAETDGEALIDSLPEHCIIDNDNHLTIEDVDKTFYIEMAKKRINDFIVPKQKVRKGIKKMAEEKAKTPKMNVYQKLTDVRIEFLEDGIKKTGKNAQLKSMYFELADIVPAAMPLFKKHGLFQLTSFGEKDASMIIVDMDNPADIIQFTVSKPTWAGNAAVTPVQAEGATVTYMRRYLYQLALDIVEADEMENRIEPRQQEVKPAPVSLTPEKPTTTAPATPAKREEIKNQLTDTNAPATELQTKQLKDLCVKLLAKKEQTINLWVTKLYNETAQFTKVTKADAEKYLHEAVDMLKGAAE